jgi:hypothetical protein
MSGGLSAPKLGAFFSCSWGILTTYASERVSYFNKSQGSAKCLPPSPNVLPSAAGLSHPNRAIRMQQLRNVRALMRMLNRKGSVGR